MVVLGFCFQDFPSFFGAIGLVVFFPKKTMFHGSRFQSS